MFSLNLSVWGKKCKETGKCTSAITSVSETMTLGLLVGSEDGKAQGQGQ